MGKQRIIRRGRTHLPWYQRIPWPVFRARGCVISGTVHPSWVQVEATPGQQEKWNKLGGVSWGWHHRNSVRLGIRYAPHSNPDKACFELCEYRYTAGELNFKTTLLPIKVGQTFRHKLSRPPGRLPWWGYRLSIMWGDKDDQMATHHDMDFSSVTIDIL